MFARNQSTYGAKKEGLGLWTHLKGDHPARTTTAVLFAGFLVLVILDVSVRLLYNVNRDNVPYIYKLVSIGRDNSFAETFNYSLLLASAILFFTTAVSARSRLCFAMAAFMTIAWFDDSAQYHERIGFEFAKLVPDTELFGVGASHIGELLAWSSIGLVLMLLGLWSSRRMLAGDWTVLRMVIFPVALLVICASVIDLLHSALPGTHLDVLFMYLEDGGEMIAVVLLAAASLYLVRNVQSVFGETADYR